MVGVKNRRSRNQAIALLFRSDSEIRIVGESSAQSILCLTHVFTGFLSAGFCLAIAVDLLQSFPAKLVSPLQKLVIAVLPKKWAVSVEADSAALTGRFHQVMKLTAQ